MKKAHLCPAFLCLAIVLSLSPSVPSIAATEFSLRSETLVRGFERETSRADGLALPIYEYLRLDAGDPYGSLTLHLYGWGRVDLGGSGFYEDDTAGELLYGYLQYVHPETNLDLRLGRQYVFEGVANESVDGLRIIAPLGPWFSGSVYTGYPVGLDAEQGRNGDFLFGGRLAHHLRHHYQVGLSYKSLDNDGDKTDERFGVDLFLYLTDRWSLTGFSSRNLITEEWAEHSYHLDGIFESVLLRPSFEYYRFDDYFAAGAGTSGPFRFLSESGEKLKVVGTDLLWTRHAPWELGVRFKHYDYDERAETSRFYSALVTWHGEERQIGGELGRMQGESRENRYVMGRGFFYWENVPVRWLKFISGDLMYVRYDEEIFEKDTSLFLSLGAGNRYLDNRLELRVAADYGSDPYFRNDLRGWLMAAFTYDR